MLAGVLAGVLYLNYLKHLPPKNKDLVWTEEVQLQNGKVITVHRRISGEPHPDYSYNRYAWVHDIEVINTSGLGAPPPTWSHIWGINIIDQDENGVWFLVIHPGFCEDWNSFYKFRQYKAINGQWQEVEFEIDKLDGRKPNLSFWVEAHMYKKDLEMREFISLADKAKETGNAAILTHQYIIRRNSESNCDTPCRRDKQGYMQCGWGDICPSSKLKHDEWVKCINHYENTVLTPSFMKK